MAISQVVATTSAGSPYDTVPPNRSTSANSNSGSAARVTDTNLLNGVEVSRFNTDVFGSTVINGTNTDPATMEEFAHNNQSPIAQKLYGVLVSTANAPSLTRSIHKIESIRTRKVGTAIRTGNFNIYNGQFAMGYPATSNDSFGTDEAASPTRSVPGELVYKTGAAVPVEDNYKEKTA